ncbi:hypothetical protein D9M68_261210 [compost metagenome]
MKAGANLTRYLHWLGSGLAIFSIAFVALRLRDYSGQIDFAQLDLQGWAQVLGFSMLYGASNLALALAWLRILKQLSTSADKNWAIRTYGVTQLGKYLPGNIFHLAGRQGLGMAAGYPAWPLAKSTFWELAILCLAGALFGLLALPLVIAATPGYVAVGAFVLAIGTTVIVARELSKPDFAMAFCWYVGFLSVSGSLFYCLLGLVSDDAELELQSWPLYAGAFVIAWLVGLVTPGAPAGVGVRELVLLLLLGNSVAEADLILAVLLGRIVTVVGDLLFFASVFFLKKQW